MFEEKLFETMTMSDSFQYAEFRQEFLIPMSIIWSLSYYYILVILLLPIKKIFIVYGNETFHNYVVLLLFSIHTEIFKIFS